MTATFLFLVLAAPSPHFSVTIPITDVDDYLGEKITLKSKIWHAVLLITVDGQTDVRYQGKRLKAGCLYGMFYTGKYRRVRLWCRRFPEQLLWIELLD